MSDDTIVGARAREDGPVVPDSIMVKCADCSQPTWVSPSSFEILASGASVICMRCFALRGVKDAEIRPISPAQVEEIRQWRLRRDG